MIKPVLLIVGTRPEGIKMIPLYFALKKSKVPVFLCSTSQHNDLLQEVFDVFNVQPDFSLNIMVPNQDLFHINQKVLETTKKVYQEIQPGLVVVQGDTTTTMAASMAAFYQHIPVAHVEAGLRTPTIHYPFPEEMNRRIVSMIAQLHFAPTFLAAANLLSERVERTNVYCTGNTVVDALRLMEAMIQKKEVVIDVTLQTLIETHKNQNKKIILITAHRRESFNGGIESILQAVKKIAEKYKDVLFIYPYHPNPNVIKAIEEVDLDAAKNIYRCKPLTYKNLVYSLLNADIVASDSGGICEEAASLGKPTLILRNETERMEAVWEGVAHLVGTDFKSIFSMLEQYIESPFLLNERKKRTIFGDGFAAEKITTIIKDFMQCNEGPLLKKVNNSMQLTR